MRQGKLRKTYASETNFNFGMWEQLINYMEDHPGKASVHRRRVSLQAWQKRHHQCRCYIWLCGHVQDLDEFMNAVEQVYYT